MCKAETVRRKMDQLKREKKNREESFMHKETWKYFRVKK